ncbi:uncharacterized protein LOC141653122 [Silene latifolia]|uniref:uncharacterized protein LOC141653122 n=1 Tax=Silene latifolia TaxID=37657 RepID=UPI003D77F486
MISHHSIDHNPLASSHLTQLNLKVNRQLHHCQPTNSIFNTSKIINPSFCFISTTKYQYHRHESSFLTKCCANDANEQLQGDEKQENKSFWGAVTLIIGTAVGPGMLGLPAATMKSGPLPSTIAILLSWVYVISSIILVAELSFATMEEDGVKEVSFTGLATNAFGAHFGAFVSLVYASLSFSLLVACVSGIGSIVSQWFPNMNTFASHSLFPLLLGTIIWFFPFQATDSTNRFLCCLMLVSIITLVGIGLSFARSNLLASSWNVFSILPAIPVTVLTLGFHVITPFICKVAGNTVDEARKAILVGGIVPLLMVLSWNLIVLGLSGVGTPQPSSVQCDPIKLLLSVESSALFAVQGFAFSALATSFIGYAVSFPKQLIDTLELILRINNQKIIDSFAENVIEEDASRWNLSGLISAAVLVIPVLVASFYPSTFSKALDFAGVYANCFLFGILPPAMAYIFKSRGKLRSSLPGGDMVLFLLFSVAVILSIWH